MLETIFVRRCFMGFGTQTVPNVTKFFLFLFLETFIRAMISGFEVRASNARLFRVGSMFVVKFNSDFFNAIHEQS